MKQKSTPIQKRLLRMIMLVCGLVLLVTCVAFFAYEYITYREFTKRELATLGQITASNITSSLAFDDKEDATDLLAALKAQKNIVAACVYDKQGKLFAFYPANIQEKDMPSPLQSSGYVFGRNFLRGYEPIIQGNNRLGTLYLKSSLAGVYSRFVLYGVLAVVFMGLSFLFAFFLSRRLQGTIVNPILHLADRARIVSEQKDYSVRAEKKNDDELGVLTDAFNHMLTQIQLQNAEINALNANLEEKIALRTTELQEANTTLTEQNHFIETIIDSSVDLIAVFDKNLHFVVLNKIADEIYQRPRQEMIGRYVLDVFPALSQSAFVTNLQKCAAGEFIHEEIYKSPVSGRYLENFFIPLTDKNDAVHRVMVIGHDITTIQLANEKLKQLNTELENSNRDLEQFAYIASHDLQEPLRKIKTFSELSERNVQHPEILKRYLGKISSSATRMTDLIKAVLNYSRLARVDAEPTEVDLNITVQQIINDLELSIAEKNALINLDHLPVVKAIPLQMSQLFLNLFTNSLKFTQRQPVITIKAMPLKKEDVPELALQNKKEYIRITFSDNGIGFDQQYADKVF
ncbi:MAG TPA: CHASE sensor domain-containing protein, partial [Flavisolibacter sp.]|nr:CHASE sensor domain-containing protein [Flavisolibacter sp.]